MRKLALFDMDGTLLNTLDDIAAACNYALSDGGFPVHKVGGYKAFVGHGPIYLIEKALPADACNEANIVRTRRIFEEYYFAHSMDFTKPYDGAVDMLKAVREAGLKTVIYSNKPHDGVVPLAKLFFGGLYDYAVGFRDGIPPKPEPDTGLEILRRFGVSAADAAYIGDTDVDMQAAKNIGVYAIGVSWGFRTRDDLKNNGADIIIDEMSALAKIVIDK